MTSLNITNASIPSLKGKVAVITGGSSGIGLATAQILASHGATVHSIDINPPHDPDPSSSSSQNQNQNQNQNQIHYTHCDITVWAQLSHAILSIGHIDYLFANAGIPERPLFLKDELQFSADGSPIEPKYKVLDVNFTAVLNTVKLGMHVMKKQQQQAEEGNGNGKWDGGSIVLTSSCTAYFPEISVPLYSALKLALVSLVRSLRHVLPRDNITINAVAPCLTMTPFVPPSFARAVVDAGMPSSSAHQVGLALVWSAVGSERGPFAAAVAADADAEAAGIVDSSVESDGGKGTAAGSNVLPIVDICGREDFTGVASMGGLTGSRWNGRVVLVNGDTYTEVEGGYAKAKASWLGEESDRLLREAQVATDFRGVPGGPVGDWKGI